MTTAGQSAMTTVGQSAMTTTGQSEAGGQKETISGSGLAAAVMEVT